MYEDEKIRSAKFFLDLLHATPNDPNEFIHFLSAFLSAARSVTQYALKEASTAPPSGTPAAGQRWYEGLITDPKYAVLKFLKDERDKDIHVGPVVPRKTISVTAHHVLHISGSADVRVNFVDEEGKPVELAQPRECTPPSPKPAPPPTIATYKYNFAGWAGPEDVLTLCDACYTQLLEFAKDGRDKKFLTP
jgi:hypothetical protein